MSWHAASTSTAPVPSSAHPHVGLAQSIQGDDPRIINMESYVLTHRVFQKLEAREGGSASRRVMPTRARPSLARLRAPRGERRGRRYQRHDLHSYFAGSCRSPRARPRPPPPGPWSLLARAWRGSVAASRTGGLAPVRGDGPRPDGGAAHESLIDVLVRCCGVDVAFPRAAGGVATGKPDSRPEVGCRAPYPAPAPVPDNTGAAPEARVGAGNPGGGAGRTADEARDPLGERLRLDPGAEAGRLDAAMVRGKLERALVEVLAARSCPEDFDGALLELLEGEAAAEAGTAGSE